MAEARQRREYLRAEVRPVTALGSIRPFPVADAIHNFSSDCSRNSRGWHVVKVLIAEDDLMIADMTEAILVAQGYEVCGIARTVEEGVALGQLHMPDLAVIDLRLADGGLGTAIASQLGIILGRLGVLYATGNISHVMLTAANGDACLAKPYRSADLLRGLEIVADIVATGIASPPFPRGFQVLHPAIGAGQAPSYG
jgi:CheY-like chemotaxis protein